MGKLESAVLSRLCEKQIGGKLSSSSVNSVSTKPCSTVASNACKASRSERPRGVPFRQSYYLILRPRNHRVYTFYANLANRHKLRCVSSCWTRASCRLGWTCITCRSSQAEPSSPDVRGSGMGQAMKGLTMIQEQLKTKLSLDMLCFSLEPIAGGFCCVLACNCSENQPHPYPGQSVVSAKAAACPLRRRTAKL